MMKTTLCAATLALFLFISCKKSDSPQAPTKSVPKLTTAVVTNISGSFATGGGFNINDGGDTVSVRGLAWYTIPNYPFSQSYQSIAPGQGAASFSSIMTVLPAKTYYVRAYAANSIGFGYGQEISFTTP